MSKRRQLAQVLDAVPLLARRLRNSTVPSLAPTEAIERVQTDLSLALRCVDLVLALDDALKAKEPGKEGADNMPAAVLDLGRLTAQGLFDATVRSGQLVRRGLEPLSYQLTRSPGGGYTLSVWAGSQRNDLPIVTTQPRFGGDRYWFICPEHEQGGDQRALHLYLDSQTGHFSCRTCCASVARWPGARVRAQHSLDLRRVLPTAAPQDRSILSA